MRYAEEDEPEVADLLRPSPELVEEALVWLVNEVQRRRGITALDCRAFARERMVDLDEGAVLNARSLTQQEAMIEFWRNVAAAREAVSEGHRAGLIVPIADGWDAEAPLMNSDPAVVALGGEDVPFGRPYSFPTVVIFERYMLCTLAADVWARRVENVQANRWSSAE